MTEIFLFLVGLVVGGMNAIAGGGMLLGYPAMLAVGISPIIASATSHIVVVPGQITAIFSYRRYLRKIPRMYLLLVIPCIGGAALGAYLLTVTSPEKFQELVPLLLFLAMVFFVVQPFIHLHLHRHIKSRVKKILPLIFIGIALIPLSIYGGYFGVGAGFAMLAFLGFTRIHDLHKMNALKNVATFCIGIVSVVVLLKTGLIDWYHGSFMAVGCAIGGYAGAHLAQRFSSHTIRVTVIIIGLVSVTYLFLKTYS